MHPSAVFDLYLHQWQLLADGEPIFTPGSQLLPVQYRGEPAMLKIAQNTAERRGGSLMVWWEGEGTARVLQYDTNALLLERAMGDRLLGQLAQHGRDEEASQIICTVAATLHAPKHRSLPELISLDRWFTPLEAASARYGGLFSTAHAVARSVLAEPEDIVVLHGDLHHGNIVDAGNRGWLAIDPKGLLGERGFDFANLFCNPTQAVATQPGRLVRQTFVVAEAAGLDRKRLLQWVLAYAGLSAAWSLEDGDDPTTARTVAELAASELTLSAW